MQGKRAYRRWCFTINNYTDADLDLVKTWTRTTTYLISGMEVSGTSTPHLQGFLKAKTRLTLHGMKKTYHPTAHWEAAIGSDLDNRRYCTKESLYYESGTLTTNKADRPPKLSGLQRACDLIGKGAKTSEIARQLPATYVVFYRGLERLETEIGQTSKRTWKPCVTLLVGTPGAGKSRFAHASAAKLASYYYKPRGKWWDGYTGQEAIVIDDYYGWIKYDELLKVLDRYPYRIQVKGGTTELLCSAIYITSNTPPQQWYKFQGYDPAAILRRIDHYIITDEEGWRYDDDSYPHNNEPPVNFLTTPPELYISYPRPPTLV